MYLTRVYLRNIRCFSKLDLRLGINGSQVPWTLVLGNNGTGKTTLLRAIAIGLCDEPSAASLIKMEYSLKSTLPERCRRYLFVGTFRRKINFRGE